MVFKNPKNEEKVFPFESVATEGRERGDERAQKYGAEQQGEGRRDDGEGVRTERGN